MGNAVSWLAQSFYTEEQVFWAAAHHGDASTIRSARLRLTPETRKYLEWQEPHTGRTALLEAVSKGHRECAQLLIEAGANCNAKDLNMNTSLHLACKRAQVEMVEFLLQVAAVNPFEINLFMKTPLDLVRSRYSNEDEEAEARLYAKCIEVLEKKFCLYSGWLYEKTDNVLSLVSGISSLNSWTRRLCLVLERGDPTVLELALYKMKDGEEVRSVCPTSVMLYNVAAGMEDTSDPRWFYQKDFTFVVRGDHLNKCHYQASSGLQNPVYFAAIDHASFDAWKVFFTHQQQQLAGQLYPTLISREHLRHDNRASHRNPQYMASAPSLVALPSGADSEEDGDIHRAIELSLQTATQTGEDLSSTNLAISLPPSGSTPGCKDQEKREFGENMAETKERSATYGDAPAQLSTDECVICYNGPQSAVCVPCGHNAVCMKCAEEIFASTAECPICRAHIRELIKLYRV